MDDERNQQPTPDATNRDDVDDQIDALLPRPSEEGTPAADEIDDSLDTVFPAPGEKVPSGDDATTREEMEVDTSNDGIDDTIAMNSDDSSLDENDVEVAEEAVVLDDDDMRIEGERVSWQAVDEYEGPDPSDDDNQPINEDSEFYNSTYIPFAPIEDAKQETRGDFASASTGQATATPPASADIANQCPACGAVTGTDPFCSQCGTDQYPESRLSALLQSILAWSRPLAVRAILLVGGLFILLALLGDSGTTALIVSAIVIPFVLLARINMQLTDHTKTGWFHMGVLALVGLAIGFPLAWFGARMVKRQWFDTGVLNFGAAGYGGNFAEAAGVAPFFVWLVVGLLIPVVLLLAVGAIPVALKMAMNMNPKESSGMMLSGAIAAGYVVASGIIFYGPLYEEMVPLMSTSQWTLTIFGLAVIRPIVWIFGGAMFGAVVWRYLRTASPASIMMPAIIASVIVLGFGILSLAAGPAGHWMEAAIGVIFMIVTIFFYHRFLATAIRNDETTTTAA